MANYKEALEQMEAQLDQWMERLEGLARRADEVRPHDRVDYGRRIDALHSRQRLAREALNALKDGEDSETAADSEGSWNELESAFFKIN